jgi:hypothetical protein
VVFTVTGSKGDNWFEVLKLSESSIPLCWRQYKSTEAPSTQLCCLLNIEDNSFGLKGHHQIVDFKNK